jgi:hypothetical protein
MNCVLADWAFVLVSAKPPHAEELYAEVRKGAAQAALAMARILDNPLALAQQPAAAMRLTTILEELRRGSARRKGRLASVQAMTKVKPDSAAI